MPGLLAGVLTSLQLAWTGHLGGRIRHPEIGNPLAASEAAGAAEGQEAEAEEDRDEPPTAARRVAQQGSRS